MQTVEVTTLIEQKRSKDGSIKFLWRLQDGNTVESIYFTFQNQFFTCISSQVGCNVGCPFCETGKQRARHNLNADEIYAQVALIQEAVRAVGGPPTLDHIALAGMGEPLLNFENVIEASTRLRADGLGQTVSVSTSGIVPKIYLLAETAATSVNKLFISLHATTKETRNVLVPINKKYGLPDVLEAAKHFYNRVGTKVTATYLLFQDRNDTDGDLDRLMSLLDTNIFTIQLSEWNTIQAMDFVPSPRLDLFYERLTQHGFEVFVQRSKGQDIEGGCGQLRSRYIQGAAG